MEAYNATLTDADVERIDLEEAREMVENSGHTLGLDLEMERREIDTDNNMMINDD